MNKFCVENRCQPWAAILVALLGLDAAALSSADPSVPGIEMIKEGNCEGFAKTNARLDSYGFREVYRSLVSLNTEQWLPCLDKLPAPLQVDLMLVSAERDTKLLHAWRDLGMDLNAVRTKKSNLMSIAASTGNIALMDWLRNEHLHPLDPNDEANELTAAAGRLWHSGPSDNWAQKAVFEWLLSRGYRWPERPDTAHSLLGSVAEAADDKLLELAATQFREKNILKDILNYDKYDSFRPLIFHARTPHAVKLMKELGVDIFAMQVDRKTGKVIFPSALFNHQISVETQQTFLDFGVSPKGIDSLGHTPLMFTVEYHPTSLELIERYLKMGAEVRNPRVDPISEAAGLRTDQVSPEQLRALIRLLVGYGASPRSGHVRCCSGSEGDLPIHTAIVNGETEFISIWMKESPFEPNLRHPKTGASLLIYTLQQENLSDEKKIGIVTELARLGVAMRSANEAPIFSALLESKKQLHSELVDKLLSLGADINAIDKNTGLTALALAVKQKYDLKVCFDICQSSDEDHTMELIRQLLRHGAQPELAGKSGESALSLAQGFDDEDILQVFKSSHVGIPK